MEAFSTRRTCFFKSTTFCRRSFFMSRIKQKAVIGDQIDTAFILARADFVNVLRSCHRCGLGFGHPFWDSTASTYSAFAFTSAASISDISSQPFAQVRIEGLSCCASGGETMGFEVMRHVLPL